MKLVIASDHGGYSLKNKIISYLKDTDWTIEDLGCPNEESVDYPDFAKQVAETVAGGQADRGILVCGTGVGMAITANKVSGIRAAAVGDLYTAQMVRQHNDLNVLCLGGRVIGENVAKEIVRIFLNTAFEGGRHENRLDKIKQLENRS